MGLTNSLQIGVLGTSGADPGGRGSGESGRRGHRPTLHVRYGIM